MMIMTWTTDKPTKPGWYWMKAEGMRSGIIEIVEDFDDGLYIVQTGLLLADIPENDRAWGSDRRAAMIPSGLTWSTDKPTKSGWYWYREPGMNSGEPMRAWVFDSHHVFRAHLMPIQGEQVEKELTFCPGEWAGPLEPPT